jgi:hypothetical protein
MTCKVAANLLCPNPTDRAPARSGRGGTRLPDLQRRHGPEGDPPVKLL